MEPNPKETPVRRLFPLSLLAAALLVLAPASAPAVVFDVNSTDDNPDAVLDGACADVDGACTLRAAVQEANSLANDPNTPDQINVPAETYLLKLTGSGEDAAATGDLDLTDDVIIVGAGAGLTIIKGKKDRVLQVVPGTTAVITDLTVTKGKLGTRKELKNAPGKHFDGGGVLNEGTLTLRRVVVEKNKSVDDAAGIATIDGDLVLEDVLISKNKASDDAAGLDQDGGTATLLNVTFEKNKAKDEAGGFESENGTLTGTNVTLSKNKAKSGGGLNVEQNGMVFLTNATFHKNKAKEGGAISNEGGASVTITNTLLDSNKKTNCIGVVTSGGGNLETGADCQLAGPGDQSNVADAGLENLADNGGETPTHALEENSPARDAGDQPACPQTDQRGELRDDGMCDVGAFEL